MLSLSIVHAREDAAPARELGAYLGRNCIVDLNYAIAGGDLLEVVGRALSADVLIVLLSPRSVTRPLQRQEWEPLLLDPRESHGTDAAYVLLEPCAFPRVLLRSNTFDAGRGLLDCARALKRWIYGLRPAASRDLLPYSKCADAPAGLWPELADQPATVTIEDGHAATGFAQLAQEEFESVFWADCRGGGLPEAVGELGVQMGLRLPGPAHSNIEAIRGWCGRYRCLIVLEGPTDEVAGEFARLGRSSVLMVRPGEPLPGDTVERADEQLRWLASWVNHPDEAPPRSGHVRRSVEWLAANQWDQAKRLCGAAVAYYKHHDRLAEALELLEIILPAAMTRMDGGAARDAMREREWILESWGVAPVRVAAAAAAAEQIPLFA